MHDDWQRSSSLASVNWAKRSFVPSDYPKDMPATGAVTVGGTIEAQAAGGWFAVELMEGRIYAIDLEGGTPGPTVLRGLHDSNG